MRDRGETIAGIVIAIIIAYVIIQLLIFAF